MLVSAKYTVIDLCAGPFIIHRATKSTPRSKTRQIGTFTSSAMLFSHYARTETLKIQDDEIQTEQRFDRQVARHSHFESQ